MNMDFLWKNVWITLLIFHIIPITSIIERNNNLFIIYFFERFPCFFAKK